MAIEQVTDFLVIGAGIAGLRAAIELSPAGRVLVITKEELGESNTQYAQGGIAVARGGEEDVNLHLADTINAGDGLVDAPAAKILVEEGSRRVEELLAWGTGFDRREGRLMTTREGAHSRPRILHANGDATGREIGRALLEHARRLPQLEFREYLTSVELIVEDGAVLGAVLLHSNGEILHVYARAVLLASGGAGQVYSETTNPSVATGDGIAMADRAGAEIADMEFYQFHPTALSLPGVARFLLSEALRGEGAYLRNARMERFMERYHPMLELAPRDVVARAITREGMTAVPGESSPVYLDMRHVTGIDLNARFPGISAFLRQHNLDLCRDLIPVRPAAHYLMGGVRSDIDGRASLSRLYVAGEAACTGVHGANRLASNSLLEGLVFGARAAASMREEKERPRRAGSRAVVPMATSYPPPGIEALRLRLKNLMWQRAGLLRDAGGLASAAAELAEIDGQFPPAITRPAVELGNLYTIARRIVQSATAREESRGAHFRNDFPARDDEHYKKHSVIRGGELRFESLISTPAGVPASQRERAGKRPPQQQPAERLRREKP